jgi:hypothetical protein
MKSIFPACLIFVLTVAAGAPVLADIPPPEVEPCRGKTAGASCTYGGAGTCQDSTCLSPSPPPSGSSYACLKCVTSVSNTATATLTSTATDTGTDTSDSGSCAMGKSPTMERVAPWLLGVVFSLLFLFGRQRRRNQ